MPRPAEYLAPLWQPAAVLIPATVRPAVSVYSWTPTPVDDSGPPTPGGEPIERTATAAQGFHYTLVVYACAFQVPVPVPSPALLRALLGAITEKVRQHAPRRWALPRLHPLELAQAIHAPPTRLAFRLGGAA